MKKGKILMKLLKIENKKGYFYSKELNNYLEIDRLDSNSVKNIIEYIMNYEDFEWDSYDEKLILNKAQQIVYKNLFNKLEELKKEKNVLLNEINDKYKTAIEKYK